LAFCIGLTVRNAASSGDRSSHLLVLQQIEFKALLVDQMVPAMCRTRGSQSQG
jgi:hypothetical protein